MLKYLLLIAIVVVAWYVWRARRDRDDALRPPAARPIEDMVRCAHCGVNLPERESVAGDDGRRYCGDAHRRLGAPR